MGLRGEDAEYVLGPEFKGLPAVLSRLVGIDVALAAARLDVAGVRTDALARRYLSLSSGAPPSLTLSFLSLSSLPAETGWGWRRTGTA